MMISENSVMKKMKEFDLEAAKAGKPVCTRGGEPVRIICWDVKDNKYPIVAIVEIDEVTEIVQTCTEAGRVGTGESDWDLMIAPEKHEGYMNIFSYDGGLRYGHVIHESREKAIEEISKPPLQDLKDRYIATIKVEWEE